jgi:hypothetical protein
MASVQYERRYPDRLNPCQASVGRTLIGRFKGRAIRDVSHQPPAGLPSPPSLGLLVGLRITGVRQPIRFQCDKVPAEACPAAGRLTGPLLGIKS